MGEVMRISLEVWASDPETFHFHPCGYIALVPEEQDADLDAIFDRHQSEGFDSTLIRGEQQVFDSMRGLFPDWKARGLTSMLHEHPCGFAFNKEAVSGLERKARESGVTIRSGVEVTGFRRGGDGCVTAVETTGGDIEADVIVLAPGPWVGTQWEMLGLSGRIDVTDREGQVHADRDMWTYWRLEEGEIALPPDQYATADGEMPPVLHVDSREPLTSDQTGELLSDGTPWGIYWKRDRNGVQGGGEPENLGPNAQVDPYGPASPVHTVGAGFQEKWTSALSHMLERFEGCHRYYRKAPSGGIGCFTADSFPIFDFAPGISNVYIVADSNHGFKMIGVGKEVARVLMGDPSPILHPFRYARFAEGDLHPVSSSPYPWA